MAEKWMKYRDEIRAEIGGGPLSLDVEAAIAEATRLAEGGAPAPEAPAAQTPSPGRLVLPRQTTLIPLEKLKDGPFQMRAEINAAKLQELAESIARNGLELPILVRDNNAAL